LEDTLRGGTRGNPVGGRFDGEGWHVTDRRDRLWYAVPRLVRGSVEFTVTGFTMERLGAMAETELFAMYEAGFGISEPIRYAPEFRENHYKCMLRVYGLAETGRVGQQKLLWGMCPSGAPGYGACGCGSFFEEPFGGSGTWDGSPQRFRIEWGGGTTRYLRNGAPVLTINWSRSGLSFGPSALHLSLGTSRPSAVDYAQLPVGVVFSDVVLEGTEGPLATCSGGATPDAGPPPVTPPGAVDFPAIEDVTVDPTHPTSVYPDPRDLSVGHADSEFYVKFRVGAVPGRVVRAQLLLHSATHPSAVGTGASVYTAGSDAWSETSLVWNARPGGRGPRLARQEGVGVDTLYTLELPPGAVPGSGTYAFAVLPEPADSNAAHFDAREVSPSRGPILRLTVAPTMSAPDAGPMDVVAPSDTAPTPDTAAPEDAPRVPVEPDVGPLEDAPAPEDRAPPRPDAGTGSTDSGVPEVLEEPGADGTCGCRAGSVGGPPGALGALALGALRRGRNVDGRRRRRIG
jgi:MYXO-CTERM domain-containing protein